MAWAYACLRVVTFPSTNEGKEGYDGKDLQKRKVLSLEWKSEWVVDDERVKSMEPIEEVLLKELGASELERLVRGWWREAGSWFRRRGEAH